MEKSKIKDLESLKEQELWNDLTDENSPEGLKHVFGEALNKLINEPNFYYLEVGPHNQFAMVKKRSDDNLIYETEVPSEIATLKAVGVEKKDEM